MTNLARIETKVRRITSSASPNQLSKVDLDNAINDFYTLDLPGELRTFNLKDTYTFYTEANVDVYPFLKDAYSSLLQPVFIAGYRGAWFQDRSRFFDRYPKIEFDQDLSSGNGTIGPYTGTITNTPILRRGPVTGTPFNSTVLVTAVDSTGASVVALDTSVSGDVGTLTGTGIAAGTVNYLTGAVSITFTNTVPLGNTINTQSVPYVASRPQSLLFYNDMITVRPIPDKIYKIQLDAYILPTKLIADGDMPEIAQWWEYLAYGAAKKIFEDRQDYESVQTLRPMLKEQERIVGRRTIIQNSEKRANTIYSDSLNVSSINGNYGFNNI